MAATFYRFFVEHVLQLFLVELSFSVKKKKKGDSRLVPRNKLQKREVKNPTNGEGTKCKEYPKIKFEFCKATLGDVSCGVCVLRWSKLDKQKIYTLM
uniref:Putative secreted protein n=1 Tax=Ixodes ricinus TaxID=34613 RepID=A0A6B0UFT0_IXORI